MHSTRIKKFRNQKILFRKFYKHLPTFKFNRITLKIVGNIFKVNNKETRTASVSIVDFDQITVCLEGYHSLDHKLS